MISQRVLCVSLSAIALLASTSTAEVRQATLAGGSLWSVRDGAMVRIGRAASDQLAVELPPGAILHDLEPTSGGWIAAGHLPTSTGTDLLIVEEREGRADLLAVPERARGRYRGQPVLLLESGRLMGLAWAEGNGHRELEIWAAERQGERWGQPELVSAKGPGSQLAPDGAVLRDGSWLVIWSAFDGEDDEIVWSLRSAGAWTAPGRVHPDNDVPDITAALATLDGEAVVAWSWFDGNDYRLKTARYIGDGWKELGAFGEKGSLYPGLIETGPNVLLLYRTIEPSSWTVLELGRDGAGQREARVLDGTNDRPLLFVDEGQPVLRWPAVGGGFQTERDRALEWQELP